MSDFWRWWNFRRLVIAALAVTLPVSAVTAGARWWVHTQAAGHVYSLDSVPAAPVALVLGSKTHRDGPAPFLKARLDTALRLFETDRADTILVSGNAQAEYDEVAAMRVWLRERNVPDDKIVSDGAGYDTNDSCARAQRVFGVESATVVTQSFHIERAVALCRAVGIAAAGVGDETARGYTLGWKRAVAREYLANVKAVIEVTVGRGARTVHGGAHRGVKCRRK